MQRQDVREFILWNNGETVGQISYNDLVNFLGRSDDPMNPYYGKLHFDMGSVMVILKNQKSAVGHVGAEEHSVRKLWRKNPWFTAAAAVSFALLSSALWFFNGTTSGAASGPTSYRTIQTQATETRQFILPDGTRVWLNGESTISFPETFQGQSERKVQLQGEAYFAVKHLEGQPFRVYSDGQIVEDIGTEFNIRAYATEDSLVTTLVEGIAKVNNTLLKPGQQAILTGGKVKVRSVDLEAVKAWEKGEFVFEDDRLEVIMQELARWYDLKIIFENPVAPETTFSGTIERSEKLTQVLRLIEQTEDVRFRIRGRTVFVF